MANAAAATADAATEAPAAPTAEAAAAPAAEAAPRSTLPKMRKKNKILLILTSLLLMAFLRTGFIFFIIGMLPTIVMYYLDRSKHRYRFKTIFACNLSGILPYVVQMLQYGPGSAVLQDIMSDNSSWIVIYGAAMVGGMMMMVMPVIAQMFIANLHQTQVVRLSRAQKKIENEWGPDIRKFSGDSAA